MEDNKKRTVFMTGGTGVMGFETLKEFSRRLDRFEIRLLARPSRKNRRKLAPYLKRPEISVTWGDLQNYEDVAKGVWHRHHTGMNHITGAGRAIRSWQESMIITAYQRS